METLNLWKLVAGLGLFLYGMMRLEEALKEMAGRRFKLFLKKYTTNRLLAILNGIVSTAILQSSSVVLLMVIAFAGAGIFSLSNSLGIILGANLGTTMTGWLVSTFGFKLQLETFVLPMIGIGSLGLIFVSRRFLFYHFFGFIISVGLLFMGLGFMKESMSDLATLVDVRQLESVGLVAYFLFGLLVTAVIQSSSAMMSIALSAVYANIIPLVPAIFIIIGADLGTTVTALLASFRGTPVKKRVGLAHFFFNLVATSIAIALVKPLLYLLQNSFGISNPLFALVAFHSSFNIIGILLFFPFLGVFEKFLNRFFQTGGDRACIFIQKVSTEVPEAALEAIRLELRHFTRRVFNFNSNLIGFSFTDRENGQKPRTTLLKFLLVDSDLSIEYEQIKKIEGELLDYIVELQKQKLDSPESESLNQYVLALRNGVQSAKSTKDIKHNMNDFRQSVSESVENAMSEIHKNYLPVQRGLQEIWRTEDQQRLFESLVRIITDNKIAYQRLNEWIYQMQRPAAMDSQIATFLNVNREIYIANRKMIESLKDIVLSAEASQNLSSLP